MLFFINVIIAIGSSSSWYSIDHACSSDLDLHGKIFRLHLTCYRRCRIDYWILLNSTLFCRIHGSIEQPHQYPDNSIILLGTYIVIYNK